MSPLIMVLLFHYSIIYILLLYPRLNLNLDLALPRYLSLSTVIDIIKLIKYDEYSFQDTSKELLLECMETLEAEDEESQGQAAVMDTNDHPKKKGPKGLLSL
jgi:hypothetical protein